MAMEAAAASEMAMAAATRRLKQPGVGAGKLLNFANCALFQFLDVKFGFIWIIFSHLF